MSMTASSPSRTPKQQQRFEAIVSAAAQVFRKKGYDAATLDEVAESLGVRKASLYRYIDGKEDLLQAVIDSALRRLTETNDGWRTAGEPLERIRVFLEHHAEVLLDNIDPVSVYFADLRSLPAPRRRSLEAVAEEYHGQLEQLVREALAKGLLDPATDPALAAEGLFGIVNYAHRWYRPGRGISRAKVVKGLPALAVASLLRP